MNSELVLSGTKETQMECKSRSETIDFMANFYLNWLQKKLSIRDAFSLTQKEMRERFINPFQWAGFVLVE
ncbi:MAG: hypothetical protein WAS56_07480 [Saprospiraceae bacterium]|jgi:CHAT domain-containing protein|nr:hypothetical protein [Saprospiraceae bacterium]MBK9994922.1 hypothetical protein [Saprospiraceae bacterium]